MEVLGYATVIAAAATGVLPPTFMLAFLTLAVLVGVLLSVPALALEEFSFRRYPRNRDVLRPLAFALVENLGYRQLLAVVRLLAFVDLARGRHQWGEMQRRGIGYALSGASIGGR